MLLPFALALLGQESFSASEKAAQRGDSPLRPNVVIILSDDQGTLDARCYGSDDLHTPNLDRLAASGVRFTQAYAHTVCCPARAALLTGRHPQRSGINTWTQGSARDPSGVNMALAEITLAEALKTAGYRTALFGKWHLGAHLDFGPEKQGFDEFFGIRGGFIDNYNHHFLHGTGFHDLYDGPQEIEARGSYYPQMVIERALRFIEQHKSRPFFLYLALNTPHYPEQPPTEHEDLYKNLPMPRRSYAAFITTTDSYVGQVLARLESLGLRENSIVIFQSDNGHSAEDYEIKVDNHASGYVKGHNYGANGGSGNTGKWTGRKGTFLEGGIRTPAIISYPKALPQGVARDQVVTIMDWYPTVLELSGLPAPRGIRLDGRSLAGVARSAQAPSAHPVLHFQWQANWAVREGPWKLVSMAGRSGASENIQLFNLADGEPERKDYMQEQPGLAARLRKLHEEFRRDVAH